MMRSTLLGTVTAIGILTFGHKAKGGEFILDRIHKDAEKWLYEDIRETVSDHDPHLKVQQGLDGTHASTFICVMAQSAFVSLIIGWLDHFISAQDRDVDVDEWNFLAAGCNSGWHRASTFGMVLSMCLNRLVWPDASRRFNAQAFQCQQLWGRGPVNSMMDQVVDWAFDPFGLMPGGRDASHASLFGYSLSLQNRAASENWKMLVVWVDAFNTTMLNKVAKGPTPPGVPPPLPLEPRTSSATSAASRVLTPPPRPPRGQKRAAEDIDAVDGDDNDDEVDSVSKLPWGGVFDPQQWSSILAKLGVAEGARLQLVLLSQASSEGLRRANWIVSQVCDGTAKKPTPFVYRACQNERQKLGLADA